MTIDELERRLRLPAPDEPTVLPALLLPIQVGTARPAERRVDLRAGRRRTSMPVLVLGTALLLVGALVGALLSGALRLEQLRDALPIPGRYAGHGFTFDYPDDWIRLTPHDPFGSSGANVVFIAGNRAVDGCEADGEAVARHTPAPEVVTQDGSIDAGSQEGVIYHLEDRIYRCLTERPLQPGEVRLVVSEDRPQAIGVGPVGDFRGDFLAPNAELAGPVLVSDATGFTERIGDMPARLIVRDASVVPDAEQLRTWLVAKPRSADTLWWIQAVLRGPDLPQLEAQVDEIVRSLRFDDLPAPLDVAERDVALAAAVDSIDRQMRAWPGRRFLACLPRAAGSRTTTIDDGPRGRLAAPLDVTCTTTVSAPDLRVWQADLEVAWAATEDHAAGRWARQILFDAEGTVHRETDITPGTGDPLAFPGDPSEVEGVTEVATFAPGDLVRSIGAGAGTALYDLEARDAPPEPHLFPEPGALLVIVSGPETYDGRPFYLADTGGEFGWVGADARGVPVLAPATVRCPASLTVTDLMYLSGPERLACAPGELTLGPVRLDDRTDVDPGWSEVDATPAWLAAEPGRVLQAADDAGLDRGLPVALSPDLDEALPDGPIEVRGHFDDPAAASCRVTFPEDWQLEAAPTEAQVRRCRERFVITSIKLVEVP